MTAILPIERAGAAEAGAWRAHLTALGVAAAAILLLFHRDAIDMVSIWWRSATFNHCFLIPPIILWLVRQRLPELRQLAPRAWAPGLVVVGAGGLAWLLGEAGSLALFRHGGLVLMLQGTAIACLGKGVSRGLAFPILYALFLVPAGEELVPPLQTLTAEMTMGLLALTGVPAHIEGIFISTPTALFRVAEACSGVRFLVAMAAYGALVANVCFRSWSRRILFMAAALILPILANGVRAWGTVYVAHMTGDNAAAVGFDHIFYGWIFFAIVIALLMAVGWRFFDRKVGEPWFDPAALQDSRGKAAAAAQIAAMAVALAALPPLWSAGVAAAGRVQPPSDILLPQVEGWQRIGSPASPPWQPHFAGADLIRIGRYRNAAGQEVDLALVVFARQEEGRELVAYGQGSVGPDGPWAWMADLPSPPNGKAERIVSNGIEREVVSFYRIGNVVTGSPAEAKLETIRVRLLGGPQRAVAVLVSSPSRPAVDGFLRDLGPVEPLADRAAGMKR